jgi:hypothetical protein
MGSREELLRRLPREGFLKITAEKPAGAAKLAENERVALIRKGNELFNLKKYDLARKIFVTTGYADGLIRLGDLYLKQSKPLEASACTCRLLTPKVEPCWRKSVAVLRHWLSRSRHPASLSGAPAIGRPRAGLPPRRPPPCPAADGRRARRRN